MKNMITYQIKNLVKQYPGFTLKIDSLCLYSNEVFCLLGPSGAGKTTLLRILNFLEVPTAGEVNFGSHRYTRENFNPPLEIMRKITTVFQRPALLNDSVWNNIVYPLKIRKQQINSDEVMAIVEELSIAELLHRPCDTLSGGEAQRVALARAMVFKPRVILLDEPTANLDPYNIRIIEAMVTKYMENSPTIVWITHNHFQAKRVGDRICLLEEGRIVEINDRDTFFHKPEKKRTREFLTGEMFY